VAEQVAALKGILSNPDVRMEDIRKAAAGLSPGKWGTELGTAVEDGGRVAVYINARNKGLNSRAAADIVDRTLYDYQGGITATERIGFKRFLPFYSWLAQNLPHMAERGLSRPGMFATIGKLRTAAPTSRCSPPTPRRCWRPRFRGGGTTRGSR
jgi:hypothetical protein